MTPRTPSSDLATTSGCSAATAARGRARRGNVVALSDLPRVTQGRLAQRLSRVDHPGRRVPRQPAGPSAG